MLKTPERNSVTRTGDSTALKRVRKRVYQQALLAGFMIVLMAVLLFAITAAWYTNIADTSGLQFKAAKWGFEGTVKLETDVVEAAPGDEGVIELTAVNESDSATAVSVNVTKADMEPVEMQQRIYFYVDTSKTRNGEVMERVYLNNTDSYTYTMFSQGSLTLTEEVHNDARIKWEWVYDVLGYYVLGTLNEETGRVAATEYLRPIEYNYDEAKTTFDTDGNLLTIDGETTVLEFLAALSAKDGYPGTIDVMQKTDGSYYPVDVDENGYGIWAYLCTYSEIEANTAYDTSLGMGTHENAGKTYTATITLTAQNSDIETAEVSTGAGLLEALKSGEDAVIKLTGDVTLGDTLTIGGVSEEDGSLIVQEVMLDLNGKTLTLPDGSYDDKESGIVVEDGSSLTIVGGSTTTQDDGTEVTVKGTLAGNGGYLAIVSGGELTMSGVSVTGMECAVSVVDNTSSIDADSKIRLVGCDIAATEEAIYLRGNGADSAQKTQLIVEDSTITSGYIGIMGNGSDGQWGTDIQIIGSTVRGYWAGVYQPQKNSVVTVSGDSEISGNTGLVVKGGTAIVMGKSTVHGTCEDTYDTVGGFAKSGFTDTGAGIYVETNYGYEIVVEVRDASTITSEKSKAVLVYDSTDSNYKVNIYNAVLSSEPAAAFLASGVVCEEIDEGFAVSPVATATEDGSTGEEEASTFSVSDRTSSEAEAGDAAASEENETQVQENPVTEPGSEVQGEETAAAGSERETQTEEGTE